MVAAEEKRVFPGWHREEESGITEVVCGGLGSGRKLQGAVEGPPEGDGHAPEMLAHDLRASGGKKRLCVTTFEGFKGDN